MRLSTILGCSLLLALTSGCTQYGGIAKAPTPGGDEEKTVRYVVTRSTNYGLFTTYGFLECEKRVGKSLMRCWALEESKDRIPPE